MITGRRQRGFTLVELLVVITIIVILLALIAPALDQAMMMAQVGVCGTTLKSMGMAQGQYGLAHRGMVTRFNRSQFTSGLLGEDPNNSQGAWYHWPTAPSQQSMLGYYDVNVYRDSGFHSGPTHLYFAKLLPSPKNFYCAGDPIRKPSNGPDSEHDSAGFFNPTYSDDKVLGSYAYNPMATFTSRRLWTQRWGGWDQGAPANRYSHSQAILAMDLLFDQYRGSSHEPYWNVLHFDGSAARATVPEFAVINGEGGDRGQWVDLFGETFDGYLDTLIQSQ